MATDTRERQLWWRHMVSILVFPVTVTLVVPALIVNPAHARLNFGSPLNIGLVIVGGLLIAGGLGMWLWTVSLFHRIGKGTLGLGKLMGEPVHLVVVGPYRHVRNPMISGVLAILLGRRPSPPRVRCCCGWRSFGRCKRSPSGSGKNRISLSGMATSTSTTSRTFRAGFRGSRRGSRRISVSDSACHSPPAMTTRDL